MILGFKLRISGFGRDRSADYATTTATSYQVWYQCILLLLLLSSKPFPKKFFWPCSSKYFMFSDKYLLKCFIFTSSNIESFICSSLHSYQVHSSLLEMALFSTVDSHPASLFVGLTNTSVLYWALNP